MVAIFSELKADKKLCEGCGVLLYRHISRKEKTQDSQVIDGDLWLCTDYDITCGSCGGITTIFYEAEPIRCATVDRTDNLLFRCAPTVLAIHAKERWW